MRSHARVDIATASALAAVAGFVDAVGFMEIGGYFVAFMSGNTTIAGVSLAERRFGDFCLAAGLVGAFVAGVVLGTLLAQRMRLSRLRRRRRMATVLCAVAAVLACAALAHLDPATVFLAPPLMAMAMGAENAVFERGGEVTIGLTYMTGTLVKLGQGLAQRLLGRPAPEWRRYFLLWSGLTAGTVAGAVAHALIGADALWVAVGCALAGAAGLWRTTPAAR